MNPVGAYLLNGYHITSDADIRDKKYDCTKAIICLMWCILIVCAIAYVVGVVDGDLTNQCSAIIADLVVLICYGQLWHCYGQVLLLQEKLQKKQ